LESSRGVLAAADNAGVRRVVMTPACAAATPAGSQLSGTVDETCWTDADEIGLSAYRRSKTLAEHAAWDFVARIITVPASPEPSGNDKSATASPAFIC
jgi:dihydroflavonol-4-reductase